MLDEKEGGDVVVWGIPVITADNGRRIWPDELKAMAVKKIEVGTKIVTVAKEIGANESLVAKWARAELPELPRRGRPQGKAPQFVEVMAPSEPVRPARPKGATDTAACQIRIGDAEISLRGDFPTEQLAEILRAVTRGSGPEPGVQPVRAHLHHRSDHRQIRPRARNCAKNLAAQGPKIGVYRADAPLTFDLTPSKIEGWVEDAKRCMENSLRANPLDIREQYEKQLKDLQEAYGEAMLELRARKKLQALLDAADDN